MEFRNLFWKQVPIEIFNNWAGPQQQACVTSVSKVITQLQDIVRSYIKVNIEKIKLSTNFSKSLIWKYTLIIKERFQLN